MDDGLKYYLKFITKICNSFIFFILKYDTFEKQIKILIYSEALLLYLCAY
jgi:hypothetical protein